MQEKVTVSAYTAGGTVSETAALRVAVATASVISAVDEASQIALVSLYSNPPTSLPVL